MITLHDLADIGAVHKLVGDFPSHRWSRGSLTMRRSDGCSVVEWFERFSPDERVRQVQKCILDHRPWQALLRFETVKTDGTTRPIDVPTVLDMARLYRLYAAIHPEIERRLTRVCIGYRFRRSLINSVREIQQAMLRMPFAFTVDVETFFEALLWKLLDRLIESLPCDSGATRMLQDLVRVRVVLRDGSSVQRSSGLAQGLSTSPILANLYLAEFDRLVTHVLAKLPARITRYSDNVLVMLRDGRQGQHAFEVVRDRLQREGLSLKETEATVVNIHEQGLDWLGLRIWPHRIEVTDETVARKTEQYRADLVSGLRTAKSTEHRIEALARYYGKLTSPQRGEEIRLKLSEKLRDQLTQTSGRENKEQETQETENTKTKTVILKGLSKREHHLPLTELVRDQEQGREESSHIGWNPLPTPGNRTGAPSPSSSAAIWPNVSKSVGLLSGAPVSPAPGEHQIPIVTVRIVSLRLAWVALRTAGTYEHWPHAVPSTSLPELELRALAAGLRTVARNGHREAVLAPSQHAAGFLLGELRPRSVRVTMAYRDLLDAAREVGDVTVARRRAHRRQTPPTRPSVVLSSAR